MKYRWELLLWLSLAFFLNQADRQIFNVLLPILHHDLGLSDVQLGLVGTVFVVANGLMVPVAGFLGDIVSRKRIIVVSLFAWSLATMCTGFGANLPYFLVTRSLATAVGEAFFSHPRSRCWRSSTRRPEHARFRCFRHRFTWGSSRAGGWAAL